MEIWLPIISTGLQIIDGLIGGYNNREQMRLEIQNYEKQARLEMEKIQVDAKIAQQVKADNLKMLQGIFDVIQNLVKTDVELKLIVRQAEEDRLMTIGNWVISKKKEVGNWNNQQLREIRELLSKSKDLDEVDRENFKSLVYETFQFNQKSIQDNNAWLVKQTEELMSTNGIELSSIKEEFKKLAGMNTQKLLDLFEQ